MSVNKYIGIGNLGRDPEIFVKSDGTCIASCSIAITKKYKDKSGEKKEHTEWVNLTFFGRLAEVVREYLFKGSKIYVEGELNTTKYDKEGQTHYSTKVIVNQMEMLNGKSERSDVVKPANSNEGDKGVEGGAYKNPFDDDEIPF